MAVTDQAIVVNIAASKGSDSLHVNKVDAFEEVADSKMPKQFKFGQAPNSDFSILAARGQHIIIISVDRQSIDRMHMVCK